MAIRLFVNCHPAAVITLDVLAFLARRQGAEYKAPHLRDCPFGVMPGKRGASEAQGALCPLQMAQRCPEERGCGFGLGRGARLERNESAGLPTAIHVAIEAPTPIEAKRDGICSFHAVAPVNATVSG